MIKNQAMIKVGSTAVLPRLLFLQIESRNLKGWTKNMDALF